MRLAASGGVGLVAPGGLKCEARILWRGAGQLFLYKGFSLSGGPTPPAGHRRVLKAYSTRQVGSSCICIVMTQLPSQHNKPATR